MKKNNVETLIFTFLILIAGCQKEKNESPNCIIHSPIEGESFYLGDTILIKSTANDEDGEIKEIKLAINGEGKSFATNSTLDYNWITINDTAGNYLITAIATDNDNAESTAQIEVKLVDKTNVATLSIDSIISITDNSAEIYCTILNTGNSVITEIGICWDTEENSSINDNKQELPNISNTYHVQLTGLMANTKYFIKGYAINNIGVGYSSEQSLTTTEDVGSIQTGSMTDVRDGQKYNTVKIANKWWFAENLNYNSEGSLYFQNDSSTYHKYGKLYSYTKADESCPSGWHLASDNDWQSLEKAMGMPEEEITLEGWRGDGIATKLKVGGVSKFEAKLGGYAQNDSDFADLGLGYWWTTTKKDSENIWFRSMSETYETIERNAYPDNYKFSIRCVKDEE